MGDRGVCSCYFLERFGGFFLDRVFLMGLFLVLLGCRFSIYDVIVGMLKDLKESERREFGI